MATAKSSRLKRNISGPRIRIARLNQHPPISQSKLARLMNQHGFRFDPSILCRIESQERGVTDLELKFLARILKTTIAWLCGERGAKR